MILTQNTKKAAGKENGRLHSPVGKLHWKGIEAHRENPDKLEHEMET